jgi:hypothetical protein
MICRCFLSGTRQRHSLPSARPSGTRQRNAPGKIAFAECQELGKVQPSAKIGLRQSQAVGKGGRRDGGLLPSSFTECCAVRHSTKYFFIFLKKISLPGAPDLAPDKLFVYFLFFWPCFFLWGLTTVNKSSFQNLGQF